MRERDSLPAALLAAPRAAALLVPVLLAACAQAPGGGDIPDPYEPVNRKIHAFNRGLDAQLLSPLSAAVRRNDAAVPAPDPKPWQPSTGPLEMVGNFGDNLSLPGKVVNGVLQGRPQPAVQNAARFLVNTTLGLGGVFDPAGRDLNLPEVDTDFGETLHVWGVPSGAYLELPVLGPSSERDLAGKIVDTVLLDPLDGVLTPEQKLAGRVARVVSKAGERARFGSTVDQVLHDSADSYAQTRLMYSQHRRYELKQEEDAIDPYAE